ncbi:hypothetical protein PMAYCL1PPCAC_09996 [Pristionchus mayeri]|uniref:RING-type domain-containing protein n=1 Tax=Pristionchus mayeri TaxID=1317129 RepID=A0AAN5CFA9_9BILA|nr:hypothetical protein PMAYCL1PPCAC_09996 [Pristionchus mayeri]
MRGLQAGWLQEHLLHQNLSVLLQFMMLLQQHLQRIFLLQAMHAHESSGPATGNSSNSDTASTKMRPIRANKKADTAGTVDCTVYQKRISSPICPDDSIYAPIPSSSTEGQAPSLALDGKPRYEVDIHDETPSSNAEELLPIYSKENLLKSTPFRAEENLPMLSNASPATLNENRKVVGDCAICMERPIDSLFVHCGHPTCWECGERIKESGKGCPQCRQPIEKVQRMFL